MKKTSLLLSAALLMIAMTITGCTGSFNEIKIGDQVWMSENLNVDKFRNGDPIPEAKTDEEWEKASNEGSPAWCYYENDPANGPKYGKLYNWYAVNDPRGLAPKGWQIPSDEEWGHLTDNLLGGRSNAGVVMKSIDSWAEYEYGLSGTNESGFNGLPGGWCSINQSFSGLSFYGYWWSTTEYENSNKQAWYYELQYHDALVLRGTTQKGYGYSVRCLRD